MESNKRRSPSPRKKVIPDYTEELLVGYTTEEVPNEVKKETKIEKIQKVEVKVLE